MLESMLPLLGLGGERSLPEPAARGDRVSAMSRDTAHLPPIFAVGQVSDRARENRGAPS